MTEDGVEAYLQLYGQTLSGQVQGDVSGKIHEVCLNGCSRQRYIYSRESVCRDDKEVCL